MPRIAVGIDAGGSTTKIVGFEPNEEMVGCLLVKAADQLSSMYGAIGHFLQKYSLSLGDVSEIVLTGVGASFISNDIYEIPTSKIDEFRAIGFGGARLSGLSKALVISMGTGSAFVRVENGEVRHIGGSGVGGGTLVGLAQKLLDIGDIEAISSMALDGDLTKVDITVQEISSKSIPNLPPHTTASNFGRIKSLASKSDIALGLINMVFQTVGMLASFACMDSGINDVVLTGSLAELPQAAHVFGQISELCGINFIIPKYPVFATAIGAVVPRITK